MPQRVRGAEHLPTSRIAVGSGFPARLPAYPTELPTNDNPPIERIERSLNPGEIQSRPFRNAHRWCLIGEKNVTGLRIAQDQRGEKRDHRDAAVACRA